MSIQTESILVVDDDAGDVELLRRCLDRLSNGQAKIRHTKDPQCAAADILRLRPTVVFADYLLGHLTGLDVVRTIRESDQLTPIIMLTGHGGESLVKECLLAGADDYLNKSAMDMEILRRALQHAEAQFLRRQAEHKLRLIEFSVQNATDPILGVNEDGNLIYVNQAARRAAGHDALDVLTVADMISSITLERWPKIWRKVQMLGTVTFEDSYGACERSQIPVEVRLDYLEFLGNQCIWVFMRDLSERKRAEAQLREKEELLHHKKRLEALGSLAGTASHEFGNLLQIILGYTSCAMDSTPASSAARGDLQLVMDAAERAKSITQQLLGFSRRRRPERAPCSLSDVVRHEMKMVSMLFNDKIEVRIEPRAEELVFVDRKMLEQVILNLCTNARDAMPDGGRLLIQTDDVEIGPSESDADPHVRTGRYVLLTISDSGVGMSSEVQAKIFEPFFTTKSNGSGTGLGLAFVYGVIEQHGGIIAVSSQPNCGTTFQIYVPVIAEDQLAQFREPAAIK